LLEKHIRINKNNSGKLIGFCVQICFESGNNSRERAEKIRRTFLSKYPKNSAYISFKEPNFRVRVGDFRTRAEARGFREKIFADFPQGFVVKDEVKYPKHIFEITE
ncbi:MAG: SPOR domain-containing protein, partial [Bacteroidales bacterium]|nr:SPOR domain-containing protein [Bacteroidales bacterium]